MTDPIERIRQILERTAHTESPAMRIRSPRTSWRSWNYAGRTSTTRCGMSVHGSTMS